MKKATEMVEYQKNRKDNVRKRVEDTIAKIKRRKTPVTKTEFCKLANISIQYLYKYPDLNEEVNKYCVSTGKKYKQSGDSKDSIINSLRSENRSLKQQLAELNNDERYKIKYEQAQERIKELELQLKNSYSSNLDMNF